MDYYYLPEPPIFFVGVGLFIAVTCGLSFQNILKIKVRQITRNTKAVQPQLNVIELQLPLFGIAAGTCIFLSSGLQIFFIPAWFAYSLSLPLTLGTAGLIWQQLNKVFAAIQEGGSEAIDLDGIN